MNASPIHVAVVVMGDVGRSPRMQYHAKSLAQLCPPFSRVTAIGYEGEDIMVRPASGQRTAKLVEKRFAPWDFPLLRRIAIIHAGQGQRGSCHALSCEHAVMLCCYAVLCSVALCCAVLSCVVLC